MNSFRQCSTSQFVQAISRTYQTGYATEHSYRSNLETYFNSFDGVKTVNEPKRSEYGAPDFTFLSLGNSDLVKGHGEAKNIGIGLDKSENSEQLQRYKGYSNLLLTNCLDFRFFKNGDKYFEIKIATFSDGKIIPKPEAYEKLTRELIAFFNAEPECIRSAAKLAVIMGGRARRLRDEVMFCLQHQEPELEGMYNTVKKLLVHDLTKASFADMYAQTLIYGLFAARYSDKEDAPFTRVRARDLIPKANPFLRHFFDHIAGASFVEDLRKTVDDLCKIFTVSDVRNIVAKDRTLFVEYEAEDPIIHFYEDFLREYDNDLKREMGAYYTPLPVVRYIISEVDNILKSEFEIAEGLASDKKIKVPYQNEYYEVAEIQVLDPATGTGTFLNEIVKYIYMNYFQEKLQGLWSSYARDELTPRLFGFELMMAPYTIAHIKLAMTFSEEWGITLDEKKRLGIFLTNALEEGISTQGQLDFGGVFGALSAEAHEAARIKSELPIMVAIGNPPYSSTSSNRTEYANSLVEKYKVEPGGHAPLQERKHWLNDDYVKFFALTEDLIVKNGRGIIAMITNRSYLDNITFRGMRWKLTESFDQIYLLDLHGNALSATAQADENVFDIKQGVAIFIGVKTSKSRKTAEVYHAELLGKRKDKFRALASNEPKFTKLEMNLKTYNFVPKNTAGWEEYIKGIALNELMPISSAGIATRADRFIVCRDPNLIASRVKALTDKEFTKEDLIEKFDVSKGGAEFIASSSNKTNLDEDKIVPLAYRPFDKRYTYFDNRIIWRLREKLMSNFFKKENLGIVFRRQQPTDRDFSSVFIANEMISDGYIRMDNKGSERIAPLYLYSSNDSLSTRNSDGVLANFDESKLDDLFSEIANFNLASIPPKNVFDYIYASLHSPSYREEFKEFLNRDFPRVPKPASKNEFERLSRLGKQLRKLHLIEGDINTDAIRYNVPGNHEVMKISRIGDKVYINEVQYFDGVSDLAWNFHIGSYQPAQKWLKDRRGEVLPLNEINHYRRIIAALEQANKVVKEIG